MTVYVINSLPNSLWGEPAVIQPISAEFATEFLRGGGFVSAVGHASTADLYSQLLGIEIHSDRIRVSPSEGDAIVAGLFTSPRRLAEGEKYKESEILSMPINWVLVRFCDYAPV